MTRSRTKPIGALMIALGTATFFACAPGEAGNPPETEGVPQEDTLPTMSPPPPDTMQQPPGSQPDTMLSAISDPTEGRPSL